MELAAALSADPTQSLERSVRRHDVPEPASAPEAIRQLRCFGGEAGVRILGGAGAAEAAGRAAEALRRWHDQFSRFERASELSRLNADVRPTVRVSPLLRRFAEVAVDAARLTGGLVDPTLLEEIEEAGYREHRDGPTITLADALALAPARVPAGPSVRARWQDIETSRHENTITRPPGVRLDGGGLLKGLFADILADTLRGHESVAIDCCGDLRLTGAPREVHVASPFDPGETIHTFMLADAGVATSGIGRRAWLGADARPAHHLLDPATGRPAFTGIVQVTAVAPTAVEAEALAKAALLSGPDALPDWLPHGGVAVLDDASVVLCEPANVVVPSIAA